MEVEQIAHIRELEVSVLKDIKNSNSIIEIKKTFLDGNTHQKVRLAALHSLRRMFRQFFGDGKFVKVKGDGTSAAKLEQFRLWLKQQYLSVKQEIMATARSPVLEMQVPAIRTVIEFACLEHEHLPPAPHMGVNTLHNLVQSLLQGGDIDIDVLLMLKDEVFSKQDCVYHAMRSVSKQLSEVKKEVRAAEGGVDDRDINASANQSIAEPLQQVIQNSLDLLRLINIAYPSDSEDKTEVIDSSTFLLPPSSIDHSEENSDDENDGGDSDSDDEGDLKPSLVGKRGRYSKKRTQLADETLPQPQRKKKKVAQLSASGRLLERACHLKEFSRAWLLLFSLPMSTKQRRLALKHLPAHVTPYLVQPVMLADYLLQTVDQGGVAGILALESLFQIIVLHNLDYPRFFEALYRMCNTEVFSAKYRSKFTTLLHTSLKSTNLPAYTVAAFIKRLTSLAIKIPGPSAAFCLAQSVVLLTNHPQCQKLIHNTDKAGEGGVYDAEVNDTSCCNAFNTSLYEATLLQQHYIPEIALMAKALENDPDLTSSSKTTRKLVGFDISKITTHNYQTLVEESLKGSKGSAPLAFLRPAGGLFAADSLLGKCFGT